MRMVATPVVLAGATEELAPDVDTSHCWKTLNGKTIKQIAIDPRLKQVTTTMNKMSAIFGFQKHIE